MANYSINLTDTGGSYSISVLRAPTTPASGGAELADDHSAATVLPFASLAEACWAAGRLVRAAELHGTTPWASLTLPWSYYVNSWSSY